MPMAGAILLVRSAHRGCTIRGSGATTEAKAVNRQRKYSDKRDVRTPFHFRLDEDSLAPQLHDTTTERFVPSWTFR
jgi:hypothetical protein